MGFLDENYLLTSPAARELFPLVRDLPIVDLHNHADADEIVKNENWTDLWQVEGATDHYVWELMRRRGVSEDRITGTASNREKWQQLATVFPDFVGNPSYEWIHLDLRRHFGIDEIISAETADSIWRRTEEALARPEMRPRAVLERMRVEVMCTTDDPAPQLPAHEQAGTISSRPRILPTWRPDKAMNIEAPGWRDFVERLGADFREDASSLAGLTAALAASHAYFHSLGCIASDHGLTVPTSRLVPESRVADLYRRRWDGEMLGDDEIADLKAYLLHVFGRLNRDAGWVMQLHIGAVRNYRMKLLEENGPDSGGDISTQNVEFVENLHTFLNQFDGQLKVVLYCVDPTHLPTLATIARAFPTVFLGSAWWWNDSPYGMESQLKFMATVDLLSNHAGMVTDSRKLISFGSRTEMFRRILCQVVGEMIEKGQVPEDPAESLVRRLCYDRPKELFFE
jgi:glucuronate isomerase